MPPNVGSLIHPTTMPLLLMSLASPGECVVGNNAVGLPEASHIIGRRPVEFIVSKAAPAITPLLLIAATVELAKPLMFASM